MKGIEERNEKEAEEMNERESKREWGKRRRKIVEEARKNEEGMCCRPTPTTPFFSSYQFAHYHNSHIKLTLLYTWA